MDRAARLRGVVLFACITLGGGCATLPAAPATDAISTAVSPAQAGLVDVHTLVPDLELDMRYAGPDNFVGERIDGYGASRCYLREKAAHALQEVEQAARAQGLRLKLFDCYRPARSVAHFMRWARDVGDVRTKSRHYPHLEKSALLGEYIAPVSGHSRGSTLDLTLMECSAGACQPLDMGTDFDFFDTRANTDFPGLSETQRVNRQRLLALMEAKGFRNYPMEWWHFSFAADTSTVLFDVPIE